MSKTTPDSTNTSADSRLTFDKGLGYKNFATEEISYIYDEKKNVIGTYCRNFNPLDGDILDLDKPDTIRIYKKELQRQFQILNISLLSLHYTSTSCLLKASVSFHQLLIIYLSLREDSMIISVAETLIDIYNEIEKRTKNPYQFMIVFDEKEMFKPLNQNILKEFPLNQYVLWKQSSLRKRTVMAAGKKMVKTDGLIPIIEKVEKSVDEKELEKALEVADANVRIKQELENTPPGDTPLINNYKANLTKLTLEDVYKQTGVTIKNRADWKLSDLIEVIYFASYITIVLDKNGEPFDGNGIYGLFKYGMILYSKKFKTVKFIPPPGKYVSLGPMAGQQFSFEGGVINKLPIQYNGILAYQEVDVTGQWEPDYQIEANERFAKNNVYIGSLVVDSAYRPNEITLSSLISTLPDIVEETMPYFYKVVTKKIHSWFENYQDFLKEIAEEVLKNILIETLKSLARKYIIKKIGSKIIPIINAIASIKSSIDAMRGKDTERDNIAVNCVRLYLKGITQDDKTLSVKILANILGDAFEDEIKSVIIKKATSLGVSLVERIKPVRKETPVNSTPADPQKQLPVPEAPKDDSPKQKDEKSKNDNAEIVNKGLKAFQETYKPLEEQRAIDNKAKSRPEEVHTVKDETPKVIKSHDDDKNNTDNPKSNSKIETKQEEESRELVNRKIGGSGDDSKGSEKNTRPKKGKDTNKKTGKGSKDEKQEEEAGGKLRSKPDKPVKVYPYLEVFTHTTREKFRDNLVTFFKNNPNHPLSAIYNATTNKLQPSTQKGMGAFYWEEHPEAIQAGHVRSKHSGAEDQIVIMTAHENQLYNRTIESRRKGSIQGGFKVAIIEGIPVSVESAKHMVQFGKLDPKALQNAQILDVDDL
jgi:hypothetical protein